MSPSRLPFLVLSALLLAPAAGVAQSQAKADPKTTEAAPVLRPRGPTRIEFDDRLLQGQTNRLGAVYLYQRKEPALPTLLRRRASFRDEIKRDVLE